MSIKSSLVEKVTSGRRFLVVIAGLAFLWVTKTVCSVLVLAINTKDATLLALGVSLLGNVTLIIQMVYKEYFLIDRTADTSSPSDVPPNPQPPVK